MMNSATVSTTQSNVTQKVNPQPTALLLTTYLRLFFNDDIKQFCRHVGLPQISKQRVQRWVANNAVVFNRGIYLQASEIAEEPQGASVRQRTLSVGTEDVKQLKDIVNIKATTQEVFAQQHGLTQQQVSRWTRGNAIFVCNQVYRLQESLDIPNVLPEGQE